MDSRDRGKLLRAGFRVYRQRLDDLAPGAKFRRYSIWVLDSGGDSWRKHLGGLSLAALQREWKALMEDERNIGDSTCA